MQDSESSGSEMGNESPRRHEKNLFTFNHVQMICERILKEREDELREKYNKVLTTKLSDQYEAFVKFTHYQIQRRYQTESAPDYMS